MNRRDFLSLAASAAVGSACLYGSDANAQPILPLKSYCRRPGFLTGTQATKQNLQIPQFAELAARNFNLLTPGLELKWKALRPQPDVYRFDDADFMVGFAETHGMHVHGHNLCWPSSNPNWMQSTLTPQNARGYLVDHINTVMKHYKGRIDSWDVVNEPITGGSKRPDLLKPGIWLDTLGPEYIDIAFHAAAEADPAPLRVLNIYGVELDYPGGDNVRRATLSLIEGMLKRNVPIQAVGLESHLDGHNGSGPAGRNAFIAELEHMGLQILVTELDVDDLLLPQDIPTRDRMVAKVYHDYIESVLASSKCRQIIFFTPWDGDAWMNTTASFRRADGIPHRPGLWDPNFQPTPSVAAVASALGNAR